ncbi:MAG: helix-hairpin-helix domain-containing protein [Candidatus Zixiibacteriota bacterium]|nr:MAG: helix-hairpin-helix domain-containing protein [candidate division Zixibacteria bacterium]
MNRYFDFTSRQLKFLAILSATALLMGGYLLVKTYAYQSPETPPFEVIVGEDQRQFTGVFVLDPNTAPADSLELLPGIGKVLADRIVAYRQEQRFESEIDITEVKGIGPKLYERIKPYLKVKPY